MTQNQRRLSNSLVLTAAAALLLVLPAIASARGDRDGRTDTNREERQRYDERTDRYSEHAHYQQNRQVRNEHARHTRHARHVGDVCHARHARHLRHDAYKARKHARYQAKHEHRAGFYCKPCRNDFDSRRGFQRHLHRAHRVPARRFSRVIVHHGLGWIFHG
jgi:hypothetical protein